MVETGAIVPPFVACLSAMNAREDIDILAKNKRFAPERPPELIFLMAYNATCALEMKYNKQA
jgi:hypothetical protein